MTKQQRAARKHLIDCAAAYLRKHGGKPYAALNAVAGEWALLGPGTLGRMAYDWYSSITDDNAEYARLERAVRRKRNEHRSRQDRVDRQVNR